MRICKPKEKGSEMLRSARRPVNEEGSCKGSRTGREQINTDRQERKRETHRDKRTRLAKGEQGARIVSEQPEQKLGGGLGIATTERGHGSTETHRRPGEERNIQGV
eukprot:4459870-Pleurochrysis_carterae.AAC.2